MLTVEKVGKIADEMIPKLHGPGKHRISVVTNPRFHRQMEIWCDTETPEEDGRFACRGTAVDFNESEEMVRYRIRSMFATDQCLKKVSLYSACYPVIADIPGEPPPKMCDDVFVKGANMKIEPWMSRFTPVGDQICCIPIQGPKQTPGGLALPDTAAVSGRTVLGQVFAVGPGMTLQCGEKETMEVEVGDTICFVKAGSYQEVHVADHTVWCVQERDVLFILHETVDDD